MTLTAFVACHYEPDALREDPWQPEFEVGLGVSVHVSEILNPLNDNQNVAVESYILEYFAGTDVKPVPEIFSDLFSQ
jgi:hypothetical protein